MARTYFAIDPIRHNGQDYAPGAPIDLDAKAAKQLLAVGAIEVAETATDPEADPEAAAPPLPNPRSGATGESPEASGAAALQADSSPQPSNADTNKPRERGDSPATAEGAAGVPVAPLGGSVVPIGTKGGKGKAKPAE